MAPGSSEIPKRVVIDSLALVAEFPRIQSRPEHDLLRFGLSARDRLPGQTAADTVSLFGLAAADSVLPSWEGGHLAPTSGRRVVKRLARGAYETTGTERFLDLSSHDLRRYWANYLLVNCGVNPRVLMRLGGWEEFQSIKPYLDRPRDSTVAEEMETAGWG
ncbi:MAG: hypothetical protein J07HX64_02948 [halophilic archaeon J07HX64]|nr:MAG: hypothetical protein J07HX64_02948 [halophilic archaeon J07HX64]